MRTPLHRVLTLPSVASMKKWVTISPSRVPLMPAACYREQPQKDRCKPKEVHSQEGMMRGAPTYRWAVECLWLRNLGESCLPPVPLHTHTPPYKVNKHCHTWERRENVSVSCCEGRQLENETPESVLLPSVLSWEELHPPLPPQDSHAEVLTLGTRMRLYLQMEPFKR